MRIVVIVLFLIISSAFGADWVKKPQSVRDTKHHLQWQDTASMQEFNDIWRLAKARCGGLSVGGHDDWRLPTKKELMYLTKSKEGKTKFSYLEDGVFWTSEEDKNDDINVVTVFSGNGFVSSSDKCDSAYAMCVRDDN
ncbi:DUF1566 domain-containing protein [Sulfurimonas autotrophica]|uniref:Lcl C-terminal domain-containing protein n=1 Tax=Sulfurimonas autotrophica (strain ATCC BAA-671 / DSM 16294 / JCM 11897 / OK10) TaxID=563040 RepID=E0UR42_SULAO|nr:DUF1566 domain-containing protein [Sulfurimonas autotrophica]ADN09998.1 conserved hypothetical protein [Sulfurimonas autotrophica DSM 16294]